MKKFNWLKLLHLDLHGKFTLRGNWPIWLTSRSWILSSFSFKCAKIISNAKKWACFVSWAILSPDEGNTTCVLSKSKKKLKVKINNSNIVQITCNKTCWQVTRVKSVLETFQLQFQLKIQEKVYLMWKFLIIN